MENKKKRGILIHYEEVPKEENKYYTPEIEEFCIGFEFESNYISYSRNNEWVKVILGEDDVNYEGVSWFYSSYVGDAVPTEFRVKYLDREDIESEGFEYYESKSNHHTFRLFKNEFRNRNNRWLFITWVEETSHVYIEVTDNNENVKGNIFFTGTIKNKSEFKRILKQIGV